MSQKLSKRMERYLKLLQDDTECLERFSRRAEALCAGTNLESSAQTLNV